VDTELVRHPQGFAGGVDIGLEGAGQGADPAVLDMAGDGLYRLEVAGGGDGEADFHHVHPEALEGQGDLQFFLDRQAGGKRLLAVPQGGIEYNDLARHVASPLLIRAARDRYKKPVRMARVLT
jgi:hypothetical protein